MSRFSSLIYMFFCLIVLQSCDTLWNISTTNFEIIVPGKIEIPDKYKKAAVRYNNCNVAVNPNFNYYLEDNEKLTDQINLDSIASEIYFQNSLNLLKSQQFFDTIFELEPGRYSCIQLNDSLVFSPLKKTDTPDSLKQLLIRNEVITFTKLVNRYSNTDSEIPKTKYIDPSLGLYSTSEMTQIADSTGADLLLSFDYFASVDGIFTPGFKFSPQDSFLIKDTKYYPNTLTCKELVNVFSCWNFYDLQKMELIYSHRKTDTIKWVDFAKNLKEAKLVLPPRKDAVLIAAEQTGFRFTEFLVPHWIEVERMYYKSGKNELKKTNDLIKQNQWMEAAKIWKKNTTHKNKYTAAKSMYNMALACEMNGEMDAAIDWLVKSFYVSGNKNPAHAFNCQEYIRILALRKLDIQKLEN